MGNKYDYRQLRQIINANHDRFSELNFDNSFTTLQKTESLAEWFKVVLKEYNIWIDYLDSFVEKFDENVYTTIDTILDKWYEDGLFDDLFKNTVFKDLVRMLDSKRDKSVLINDSDIDKTADSKKLDYTSFNDRTIRAIQGTGNTTILDDRSITRQKIALGSVGAEERVPVGNIAYLIPHDETKNVINFNFTDGQLEIPINTRCYYDNSYVDVTTDEPLIIPFSGSYAIMFVVFDKSDNMIKLVDSRALLESMFIVSSYNELFKTVTFAPFRYTVNKKFDVPTDSSITIRKQDYSQQTYDVFSGTLNFNTESKTLSLNAVIYVKNYRRYDLNLSLDYSSFSGDSSLVAVYLRRDTYSDVGWYLQYEDVRTIINTDNTGRNINSENSIYLGMFQLETFENTFFEHNNLVVTVDGNVKKQYMLSKLPAKEIGIIATSMAKQNSSYLMSTTNSLNSSFNMNTGVITIDAQGFFFPFDNASATRLHTIFFKSKQNLETRVTIGLKDKTDAVIARLPISRNGDSYVFDESLHTIDYSVVTKFEVRLDNRTTSEKVEITDFKMGINGFPMDISQGGSTGGEITFYCDSSFTGSSTGSSSNPYKQIQEAIDNGATNIICKPGIYKPFETVAHKQKLNIYCEFEFVSGTDYTYRNGIVIDNSETLTLTPSGTLFTTNYTAKNGSRMKRVFIDKTLEPVTVGTRSDAYNVSLWEVTSKVKNDKRLKPVLTLTECQNQEGSFFYDGSVITIHAYGNTIANKTFKLADDTETPIKINNVEKLYCSDLTTLFGYTNSFNIQRCYEFELVRCKALYCANGDNFTHDLSNGKFSQCESYWAKNDGFNGHYGGHSVFEQCKGMYNFDDGVSQHEHCTVAIIGGEWAYNGKGGISPVHLTEIEISSAYMHHNRYGLYLMGLDKDKTKDIRINNCVLKNNTEFDLTIDKYNLLGWNNIYDTKNVTSDSTFVEF